MAQIDKSEFHLPVSATDKTCVELLADATGYSKQTIKKTMQCGAVWLSRGRSCKRLRRVNKSLHPGDTVHLYYDPKTINSAPEPARLIEDHGSYSIWFKPRGMLSQGSKWGDHWAINRWVETHLNPQRPAFIVHRLDRATSGLLILAHSKKLATRLSSQFENREIKKYYTAIVEGVYSNDNHPQTIKTPVHEKPAISHIQLLATDGSNSLLEVHIETGRKHQIRIHLSSIGLPIVGDRLYGTHNYSHDLQLTASKLSFICPESGQHLEIALDTTDLPKLKDINGST